MGDVMADDLGQRLARCYTGVVHDVMREMGLQDFVLPHEIRPLNPEKRLAGPAFTVSGHIDKTLEAHETLLAWTGMLGRVRKGAVLVCQPHNHTIAHMGELSAETLLRRGVLGYVVDGGCRDTEFIARLGFPVFHRYATPRDIVGQWKPDAIGAAIRIGTTTVHDGDYMLGDSDGVVVIPRAEAARIIAAAETAIATENKVRTAILDGADPQQAYLEHGKF